MVTEAQTGQKSYRKDTKEKKLLQKSGRQASQQEICKNKRAGSSVRSLNDSKNGED